MDLTGRIVGIARMRAIAETSVTGAGNFWQSVGISNYMCVCVCVCVCGWVGESAATVRLPGERAGESKTRRDARMIFAWLWLSPKCYV